MVLGLIVFGFAFVFAWNQLFPPAFSVVLHDTAIDYEFRDRELGEEFARLNGATEPL